MRPLFKRLALERKRKGLSQVQLGDVLRCHWTTVSGLERGVIVLPSPRVRRALELFFGLTLEELLQDMEPAGLAQAEPARTPPVPVG
jgi:transcriptional regulator with XRE-family HTH domain